MNAKQRMILADMPMHVGSIQASSGIYVSKETGLAGWQMGGPTDQDFTATVLTLLCEKYVSVGRVFPGFYVLTITPLGRKTLEGQG